jgi:hypothetical protein
MVGDQRRDAEALERRHAFDAGDAVVHRDHQVRLARRRQLRDFRRQPVTQREAIGHDVIHRGAHHAQGAQADRAAGGAVAVVVGDDQHAAAGGDRVGQQRRRLARALEPVGGEQGAAAGVEFVRAADAARGIQPGQ